MNWGVSSMTEPLRRVGLRKPGAILAADHRKWHYAKPINPQALLDQYDRFVQLLRTEGAEIVWLPDNEDGLADSVFTYDPSFVIPAGAVLLRPGKELRLDEVALHRRFYETIGVPIVGRIEAPGTVEGGDCFWLDSGTIAVGRGYRTNQAGIDQLVDLLRPEGITVAAFDLPHHTGPDACLHLMSIVSCLDSDLALVRAPLMPVALYSLMRDMGFHLLDAPADEFEQTLGLSLNVLATAPRRVIAIDGAPRTAGLMRDAGCEVATFAADELCVPCEGGPTCLTRPLLRRDSAEPSETSGSVGE